MSVAAHSLYEQSDPIRFVEPEGTVDIAAAEYRQVDEHTVRVSGTRFLPSRDGVTIKLEGAALKGYRTIAIAGVRDPKVIANLDVIEEAVRRSVAENAGSELTEAGYELGFRYYGRDAVLGSAEPLRDQLGHEIGVLIEAVAPTQDASSAILALARSSFLHCHFDGRVTTAGNAAFAFSPSDLQTGPVYDFSIYHVLSGESESRLFPVEHVEFGAHDGAAV